MVEQARSRRDPEREGHWRGLMVEWRRSGMTIRAFCRERGLNDHTFYGWRRELKRRDGQGPSSGRSRSRRFVELSAVGVNGLSTRPAEGTIEIVLDGRTVVRVGSGVDGEALRSVLGAVRQAAPC